MPAILIECCFVDSTADMNLFDAEKMAEAIKVGLIGDDDDTAIIQPGILKVTQQTILKPSTEQSSDLPQNTLVNIDLGLCAHSLIYYKTTLMTSIESAFLFILLSGAFGGLIQGLGNNKEVILPHLNSREKALNLGFIADCLSGMGGAIAIYLIIPTSFKEFTQDLETTIQLIGLSLVGGYSGNAILARVLKFKVFKDDVMEKIKQDMLEQEEIDAEAYRLLDLQLSRTNEDVEEEILKEAIQKSSNSAQQIIFRAARDMRQTANDAKRNQNPSIQDGIERTIPIFEALIKSEYGKNNHRYFGNLGYALKDKEEPDWEGARNALVKAINLSQKQENTVPPHYMYNLAVCLIQIDNQNNSNNSISKPNIRRKIRKAIELGSSNSDLKESIQKKEPFTSWLSRNQLQLEEGENNRLSVVTSE